MVFPKFGKGYNGSGFDTGFYYADLLFESLEGKEFIVIDDLRFWEELIKVTKLKGVVYKIQATPEVRKSRGWQPNPIVDNDLSETEMDLAPHTFWELTGGGGLFNNEANTDNKFRKQIYSLLSQHF